MANTTDVAAFFKLLEKSQLLSAEEFSPIVEKYSALPDITVPEIVRELVDEQQLTNFQGDRLQQGRYRGFFLDEYKILEILGAGGMGDIYIGENTVTNERFALKVVAENHEEDRGMLARFKLEAEAGMRLDHPNVVRTYKIDQAAGVYYFVMDFVEGVSLHELLTLHGPVGAPQTCDFFMQAAEGLQHLHEAGLVHRDLKPANLLIDGQGCVRLLDFGLSHFGVEDDSEFTLAMIFGHDCLGTPDYIAPEQALDSFSVTPQADIYSLGCTMYLTLTGALPAPYKTTAEKLEAHRNKQPRPIRDIKPEVPQEVADIVNKMMEKKPQDRFESAAAVAKALQPFAKRRPVHFNFEVIRSARAREAQQRTSQLRQAQSRPAATLNPESNENHGI